MQDKKHFIVIAPQNDLGTRFFDLKNDNRVTYIEGSGRKLNNRLLQLIKRIHLSTRINKYIDLPFKSIWGCNLDKIDWNDDTTYYLVACQGTLWPIKPSYLKQLRDKYKIKFAIVLYDYWDSKYAKIARYYIENLHFDYIFSFDPNDCSKYGFEFTNCHYSKLISECPNDIAVNYDIYFAGNNKNRIDLLHEIYDKIKNNKAVGYFRISEVPKKDQKYSEIVYNKNIRYDEVIEEIIFANCILEILQSGQSGATLRYYEAVCYNKKLLTNNKNVVNLPFYNPDYIHVFEKPEDIDWEWVKERIPVDYHYDGRFSPTHLIDKIIELEEEKERKELGKVEAD